MPLITISYTLGSEGLAIARKVADTLGTELFDDPKLQRIALDSGMRADELAGLNEEAPGLLDRILGDKPRLYQDLMESLIYEVAKQGDGVILGHGSQMLLRSFDCAFHVRIHASDDRRIENVVQQQGMDKTAAEKVIRRSDSRQKGFFRYAFELDWNDTSLYDLIVNTGKIGIDSAARLIVETSRSGDINACSIHALDTISRLSMEKKVHAALVKSAIDTRMLSVEVPTAGHANVSGLSHSREEIDRIESVVRQVPGLSEVKVRVASFGGGHI